VTFKLDLVGGEIGLPDLLGAAQDPRQQLAQGHDHVLQIERRADGVGEQRAEDEMVFLVEKDDVGVTAPQAGA
jgi:hypothetical protein